MRRPRAPIHLRSMAVVLAVALVAAQLSRLPASQTDSWRTVGDEFRMGRPSSTAVAPQGRLGLAPERRDLGRWDDGSGWSIAVSRRGEVFVGTGDEGRIYRTDAEGRAELFVQLTEVGVHALAIDTEGRLLAAASPGGKVYRIGEDRVPVPFFDSGERYVWALEPLPDGTVLVATGDHGRVYRVDKEGKSVVLYEGRDAHVRSLVPGPDGSIWAGTSGRGLVIRIARDGKVQVVLDSDLTEVDALAFDDEGRLYAAATGSERPAVVSGGAPTTTPTTEPPLPPGAEGRPGSSVERSAPQSSPPPFPATPPPGARIYRIDPDGVVRSIWESKTETVYALAPAPGDGVWAGTGPDGSLYRIDRDGRATWFGKGDGGAISALESVKERLFVLNSSPVRLRALGPGLAPTGTYESKVFDARVLSKWGKLRWTLDPASGGTVSFAVRSGNTEEPDATWSDWGSVTGPHEGADVAAPPARYIQWKATLSLGPRKPKGDGPVVSEVELRSRARNLPPLVANVSVLPAGIAYQVQPGATQPGSETQIFPNRYAEAIGKALAGRRMPPNYRRFYLPGARTTVWEASDPNGDDLVFTVEIRAEDEQSWRPLAKHLGDSFLTWDSHALADGWYRVRIAASDEPGNPAEEVLTGDRQSEPFVVDNTPPTIEGLETKVSGASPPRVGVAFRASDSMGRILFAEYSVDSGDWHTLTPTDGVEDSRVESYRFETDLPDGREHVILVRASDEGGNWASARALVGSPAR